MLLLLTIVLGAVTFTPGPNPGQVDITITPLTEFPLQMDRGATFADRESFAQFASANLNALVSRNDSGQVIGVGGQATIYGRALVNRDGRWVRLSGDLVGLLLGGEEGVLTVGSERVCVFGQRGEDCLPRDTRNDYPIEEAMYDGMPFNPGMDWLIRGGASFEDSRQFLNDRECDINSGCCEPPCPVCEICQPCAPCPIPPPPSVGDFPGWNQRCAVGNPLCFAGHGWLRTIIAYTSTGSSIDVTRGGRWTDGQYHNFLSSTAHFIFLNSLAGHADTLIDYEEVANARDTDGVQILHWAIWPFVLPFPNAPLPDHGDNNVIDVCGKHYGVDFPRDWSTGDFRTKWEEGANYTEGVDGNLVYLEFCHPTASWDVLGDRTHRVTVTITGGPGKLFAQSPEDSPIGFGPCWGPVCSALFNEGSVVRLEVASRPTESPNFRFDHWDGDCTGTRHDYCSTPLLYETTHACGLCDLRVDGDKNVTAHFSCTNGNCGIDCHPCTCADIVGPPVCGTFPGSCHTCTCADVVSAPVCGNYVQGTCHTCTCYQDGSEPCGAWGACHSCGGECECGGLPPNCTVCHCPQCGDWPECYNYNPPSHRPPLCPDLP